MGRTLLDKIWDAHTVRVEDGGRCVLYIDRQYIHEVTSPVAFGGIERRGFGVARPAQITATAQRSIESQQQQALVSLKGEVGVLATALAGKILGSKLENDDVQSSMIDQMIADLDSDKK